MRLGDLDALKKKIEGVQYSQEFCIEHQIDYSVSMQMLGMVIDNAPPVEVPEDEVNCVLTLFGKCSYNETGCSDCEIKDKIRKALNARPKGEWIIDGHHYKCSRCGKTLAIMFSETDDDLIGCPFCLADMRGGAE